MSERVGFSLPVGFARPIYIQTLFGTIIGLLFPYWQEIPKLLGIAIPLHLTYQSQYSTFLITGYLLSVIFMIAVAWYHAHRNWFFVSHDGVDGADRRGVKAFIAWAEPITIKKGSDMGIKCLVISSDKNNKRILLPISIASSLEFKAMLGKVAPSTHKLNRFVVDAL